MPLEYLELVLCRDVYHCPPSQLPPWHRIKKHLTIMEVEAQVQKARSQMKGKR
jgi:hypothetical protein